MKSPTSAYVATAQIENAQRKKDLEEATVETDFAIAQIPPPEDNVNHLEFLDEKNEFDDLLKTLQNTSQPADVPTLNDVFTPDHRSTTTTINEFNEEMGDRYVNTNGDPVIDGATNFIMKLPVHHQASQSSHTATSYSSIIQVPPQNIPTQMNSYPLSY